MGLRGSGSPQAIIPNKGISKKSFLIWLIQFCIDPITPQIEL